MYFIVLCLFSFIIVINATHGGGHSTSHRQQDNHGNYKFGYKIQDKKGGENSRAEKGDAHGNVVGSYSLSDGNGGQRLVHYTADDSGFKAKIDTNEKGTSDADAADAIYNGLDDKWNSHNSQRLNHNKRPNYANHDDNHNSYNRHNKNKRHDNNGYDYDQDSNIAVRIQDILDSNQDNDKIPDFRG